MKKNIQLLLVLFFLFINYSSRAQVAEDIVEKYIKACGGRQKLSQIKSVVYSGKQDYYGLMESIVITEVKDSLQRYDINVNGEKGLWMVTRNFGGEFFPWETKAKKPFMDSLRKIRTVFNVVNKLVTYKEDSSKVVLLGNAQVDSFLCYKIFLMPKKGRARFYWIDEISYLLIKSSVDYEVRTSQNDKFNAFDMEKYSNWKNVDGIMFPFTTTTEAFINGKSVGKKSLYLSDIQINKPIAPELYQLNVAPLSLNSNTINSSDNASK